MQANHQSSPSIPELNKELGLSLPAGAKIVGVRRESGIDDAVQAKVEIRKTELAGFIAKTPIDPEAMRPGTAGFLGADLDFWDPHKASALRTGQAKTPNGRVLSIGVDESRADIAVLYIMQHGI